MAEVSRRTLVDQVADAILEQVLGNGHALGVGDSLPSTSELAERFDVSAVVVREAMATLAGRGLIVRRQGREPVVAQPGPDVLDSIFRVRMHQDQISPSEFQQCRAALELQSAALAATRGDRELRAQTLLPPLHGIRAGKHLAQIAAADMRFHLALVELAGNQALALILTSLHSLLREAVEGNTRRLLERYESDGLQLNVDVHEAVAQRVIEGDRRGAVEAMANHFLVYGDDLGSVRFAGSTDRMEEARNPVG